MARYADSITFNGVALNVLSVTPSKVQKIIKQKIGKTVSEVKVLGRSSQQWELEVSGKIYGTTLANVGDNRANLEALDSATPYAFVDGIHNGTYIMKPGSLDFSDTGSDVNSSYTYKFSIVEE